MKTTHNQPKSIGFFKTISGVMAILTTRQRKIFWLLQLLIIVSALVQVVSVASLAPFMAVVSDMSIIDSNKYLHYLYELSGSINHTQFLKYLGVATFLLIGIGSFISVLVIWASTLFAHNIGKSISNRLYSNYLHKSWLYHTMHSSAHLIKQIKETERMSVGIIAPILQINARLTLVISMVCALFIVDSTVAIVTLMIFTTCYLLIFTLIKKKVSHYGQMISIFSGNHSKLLVEGFGGIQEILLLNRQDYFTKKFTDANKQLVHCIGANEVISKIPRHLVELVAIGSIVLLIIHLLDAEAGNLSKFLPILGVYALAGLKLLPACQQIYSSAILITGNKNAFYLLEADLASSSVLINNTQKAIPIIKNNITLKNIHFTYPTKTEPSLNNISLNIPVNKTIGLVGTSGSGKSTLINVLLGLLSPQKGELMIDDQTISASHMLAWQNTLGFVPQNIFLSNSSVTSNIAFGLLDTQIDFDKIDTAIKLANLTEFIKELPDGINTMIGERGIQISGGQRQRIGIARSLYHNASVLIFDEATSSLDGITEKLIMEAIRGLSGKKTIVLVAHRLQTVRQCDIIYLMNEGKIVDSGRYQQLLENNVAFRNMAGSS